MKDHFRYIVVEAINSALMHKNIAKLVCILQYGLFLMLGFNRHQVAEFYLKIARALSLYSCEWSCGLENKFISLLNDNKFINEHSMLNMFLKSPKTKKIYDEFSNYGKEYQAKIKFPRTNDFYKRQGDLIMLKPYIDKTEKGVLLIQYNDSMKRFAALYNLPELAKHYRIILEPSTWGYQYIEYLYFYQLDTDIIVQAQRKEDYDYIKKIGKNLVPIRIGAGDWINPDMFTDNDISINKEFDLIMVASWLCLKRHKILFKELEKIKKKLTRIALVGYPINGRTIKHIIAECKKHKLLDLVSIYEEIPNHEVSNLLRRSKCSVMLSKREGANKAIYESIFSNVPVIVSETTVGINRDHINDCTGVFSSDDKLHEAILYMITNYQKYNTRDWAINNTGCYNSSSCINNLLKELSHNRNENWTVDIYQRKGGGKHILFNDEYYSKANLEFEFLAENYLRYNR